MASIIFKNTAGTVVREIPLGADSASDVGYDNTASGLDAENVQDAIDELSSDSGGGLSTNARNALLACFRNVAWANENGQSYYNALEAALLENVIRVTGVTLSSHAANIYVGYSVSLNATVAPTNASDKTVVWSSSDSSVVTVTANGLSAVVHGVGDGSAVITCTTNDGGFLDTFTATVATATVQSVSVSPATAGLYVGGTVTLEATVLPNEVADKTVTWTANNALVTLTPSADTMTCTVTGVGEGSVTITATAGGVSGTAALTVEERAYAAVTPTLMTKTATNQMFYYYYAAAYADLDTTDTSTIQQKATWRTLVFDCSNATKIRIKMRAAKTVQYPSKLMIQCANSLSYRSWISDKTTSDTTDAVYDLYNAAIPCVEGSEYVVGEFTLNPGYKQVILGLNAQLKDTDGTAMDSSSSSSDLADYTTGDNYYITTQQEYTVKVEIME